jgi:phage N-6-adenine-methyltransferase
MSKLDVHFSSKTDNWTTPQKVFDELNVRYGPFELDVCASHENAKCKLYLTKDGYFDQSFGWVSTADGLNGEWASIAKKCWMNPPYGRGIKVWIRKAYEESQKGCLVVCLLPARTDTSYFHEYCIKGEIEFIRGRLKFGDAKNSAPFPSMIVVFRPQKESK